MMDYKLEYWKGYPSVFSDEPGHKKIKFHDKINRFCVTEK